MAANKKASLKVTPGSAWRQPRIEGHVYELPSGNVARLRPVALDMLITSGKLPDLLTPVASKVLWTEINTEDIGQATEIAKPMAELFSLVCEASFIEPKIVEEPEADDEISLEDISFEDKAAVFQIATLPAKVLERFRERQGADVDVVPDGDGDGNAAQLFDKSG